MYKYDICIISAISIIVPASMGVPADILATSKRSYGQQHSFQILSAFSYDNFASQPTQHHGSICVVLFKFICYSLKFYSFYFDLYKDC